MNLIMTWNHLVIPCKIITEQKLERVQENASHKNQQFFMDNLSTYHPVSSNKSNVNLTVTPNCVNQRNHTHITNNCFSNASKAKSLRIMHQNIREIAHKVEEFLTSITLTTPQVICLSEHHLRKEEINSICLEQYTLGAHFCRRTYKRGCGDLYLQWHSVQ